MTNKKSKCNSKKSKCNSKRSKCNSKRSKCYSGSPSGMTTKKAKTKGGYAVAS